MAEHDRATSKISKRRASYRFEKIGHTMLPLFFLSAQIAAGQNQLRWLILPKLHIFVHVCLDVGREKYNPRSYHCFSGEDYMGYLKLVAQSTPKAERFEERMLKRSLLKVITSTPAALERLVIGKS